MNWQITALVAAISLSTASAAWAEVPALEDFKALCLETRADTTASVDAAEKAGWTAPVPQFSENTVGWGGNPETRILNQGTADFRILSVGHRDFDEGVRSCELISAATFEDVTTAVNGLFGQPSDTAPKLFWAWRLMRSGEVTRPFRQDSDLKSFAAQRVFVLYVYDLRPGSIIAVDEYPVDR